MDEPLRREIEGLRKLKTKCGAAMRGIAREVDWDRQRKLFASLLSRAKA